MGLQWLEEQGLLEIGIRMVGTQIIYWAQSGVPGSRASSWKYLAGTTQQAHLCQVNKKGRLSSPSLCWEQRASMNKLNSDTAIPTRPRAPSFHDLPFPWQGTLQLLERCAEFPRPLPSSFGMSGFWRKAVKTSWRFLPPNSTANFFCHGSADTNYSFESFLASVFHAVPMVYMRRCCSPDNWAEW